MEDGEWARLMTPGSRAATAAAADGPSTESLFNMKLLIQQLQAKIEYLGGGADAEQLADLLMEKEQEGRDKDKAIVEMEARMVAATEEAAALKVRRGGGRR